MRFKKRVGFCCFLLGSLIIAPSWSTAAASIPPKCNSYISNNLIKLSPKKIAPNQFGFTLTVADTGDPLRKIEDLPLIWITSPDEMDLNNQDPICVDIGSPAIAFAHFYDCSLADGALKEGDSVSMGFVLDKQNCTVVYTFKLVNVSDGPPPPTVCPASQVKACGKCLAKDDPILTLDTDSDGQIDCDDNCPLAPNPDQLDADGDGVGDACKELTPSGDEDNDGVLNASDNCPLKSNANQLDADNDGAGAVCDENGEPASSGTPKNGCQLFRRAY